MEAIHRPDPMTQVKEIMRAYAALTAASRIRWAVMGTGIPVPASVNEFTEWAETQRIIILDAADSFVRTVTDPH